MTTHFRPLAWSIVFGLTFALAPSVLGASFETLHSFGSIPDDGATPVGTLARSGSTLYGATREGGAEGVGSLFRIGTGGGGYQVMHDFTSTGPRQPATGLTLVGNKLYGALGIRQRLYEIGTDGGNYADIPVIALQDPPFGTDERSPNSDLVHHDGVLWGTALAPLSQGASAIYGKPLDGSFEKVPARFGTDENGSVQPTGTLAVRGSQLWGVLDNSARLYHVPQNSSLVTYVKDFDGLGIGDPVGGPTIVDPTSVHSTIYGTTMFGIYKIGSDGSGFEILHEFAGGPLDGLEAQATMVVAGSKLIGTTNRGGSADLGTVFSIGLDGSGFEVLHSFGAEAGEGHSPGKNNILLDYPYVYGTTTAGGEFGTGTVWSLALEPVPEPSSFVLAGGALCGLLALVRHRRTA